MASTNVLQHMGISDEPSITSVAIDMNSLQQYAPIPQPPPPPPPLSLSSDPFLRVNGAGNMRPRSPSPRSRNHRRVSPRRYPGRGILNGRGNTRSRSPSPRRSPPRRRLPPPRRPSPRRQSPPQRRRGPQSDQTRRIAELEKRVDDLMYILEKQSIRSVKTEEKVNRMAYDNTFGGFLAVAIEGMNREYRVSLIILNTPDISADMLAFAIQDVEKYATSNSPIRVLVIEDGTSTRECLSIAKRKKGLMNVATVRSSQSKFNSYRDLMRKYEQIINVVAIGRRDFIDELSNVLKPGTPMGCFSRSGRYEDRNVWEWEFRKAAASLETDEKCEMRLTYNI